MMSLLATVVGDIWRKPVAFVHSAFDAPFYGGKRLRQKEGELMEIEIDMCATC